MASKHRAYRALKASWLFPPTPKKAKPGVEKSRFKASNGIVFRGNPHLGHNTELVFVKRINGKRIGTMSITSNDTTLLRQFSEELIKFIKRKQEKRKMPKKELIKEARIFLEIKRLNGEQKKLVIGTISELLGK